MVLLTDVLRLQADASVKNSGQESEVRRFSYWLLNSAFLLLPPGSGGFDLVSGFAFFVEANQYQKSKGKSKNDRRKSK
jgi:hypothetical protein